MRKSPLFSIFGLLTLIAVGVHSCKKTEGIDNNNVILTPYSLYFADTAGALYKTNDGRKHEGVVFPPDGRFTRALTASGNNLLWAKSYLYVSNNDGNNFSLTYDSLSRFIGLSCTSDTAYMNQSMLVNLPRWDNRVYTMSSSSSTNNWMGLVASDNNGNIRTWNFSASYDTFGVGTMPIRMKSLTMLADGTLCGLAYSGPADGDLINHRNFVKAGKDDNIYANRWKEVTANPKNLPYVFMGNMSGTPLPPYGTYTATGFFTLGHLNNRLIAIDATCNYGAWYSDDKGANWRPYGGLPTGTPLLCIEAPFEEVCLVGTAGKGLYILNVQTDQWEPNNKGLASNLTVRSIAAKQNVYKNGTVRKFIYLATNKGIYESSDGGRNWTMTIGGNYVSVN
jgi:hypothetical protein